MNCTSAQLTRKSLWGNHFQLCNLLSLMDNILHNCTIRKTNNKLLKILIVQFIYKGQ